MGMTKKLIRTLESNSLNAESQQNAKFMSKFTMKIAGLGFRGKTRKDVIDTVCFSKYSFNMRFYSAEDHYFTRVLQPRNRTNRVSIL